MEHDISQRIAPFKYTNFQLADIFFAAICTFKCCRAVGLYSVVAETYIGIAIFTGSRVDGLAIASQSRLIYFTDSNRNQIGIMSFDGRDRKIVVRQNISSPRAVIVDQQSGLVHSPTIS